MAKLFVGLLKPIATSYGVSEADLQSYTEQLIGYIYVILAALIAMIVVLVVAGKAKKGLKAIIRWQAVLAFVAIVALVVNLICYGPMYGNVSGVLNAADVTLSQATTDQSRATIQKIGEDGLILAKNEGLLPLASDVKKLNVFGWDSTNPLFGGTGSGSSDSSTAVGFLQSLKDAGYETNEELTKMYTDYRADRPVIAMGTQDWTLPEPTVDAYTDEVMKQAKDFSDTAVIVIGRSGGEGADLPTDMNAVIKGTYDPKASFLVESDKFEYGYGYMNATYTNNGSYDDFEPGESYLELSKTEEDMVAKVCSEFDKVIVVINANNTMELGWVNDYKQIGAVILAPAGGATGFVALGNIINGSVNPSGKTADIFVKDLMSTPYINNIGNNSYTNVDDLKKKIKEADAAYEGNLAFVNYVEGIYVGYKFYETAAEEKLINYDEQVQYPFGYGLSYTTFEQKIENFKDNGDAVAFDVSVKNTGSVAGKDTVEVYFTPPYTDGGIEKASVNLVQFEKTEMIEPGASQTVSFNIPKEEMAAYDSDGIKVVGGGYILEAGEYTVSIRSDSHTVLAEEQFKVASDIDYSKNARSSDGVAAVNQFEEYAGGNFVRLSRTDGFKNYEEACGKLKEEQYVMDDKTRAEIEEDTNAMYDGTKFNNDADEMPTMGAKNGLKLYDMAGKPYDDPDWDKLLDQMTFEEMATLINMGGWQTAKVESVGKIATNDCDGPAGLSHFITGAKGTAYGSEVLMAQTWNKQLMFEVGRNMGQEYAEVKNYGWYGPAMNTHRSAFAGRNFEYFSEDGVLGGYLSAQELNGAAELGVYPYIKHFAVNDQEINRCSFLLTFASEQAIREIYLKPFELAVKGYTEGKPLAAMSAFNFIGTEPAYGNPNLLNTVLRDEWGFVGMVETDYNGSYGYQNTDHAIRSGNDLMLGFGSAASNRLTDQSATAVKAMRQACKNILYTVGNSGHYVGVDKDPSGIMTNMTKLFIKADVAVAAVILIIEIILIMGYLKKKKEGSI